MCLAPERKPTSACMSLDWAFSFTLFKVFSFWEVQNRGPKSWRSVIHSTTSQGSLLIFKGENSSIPQRLVSVCPCWRLVRPLLQVSSSFQRRSPFILLPNGSWKGSTANSQIAAAGELEQFDWWSKRVRKSFCNHKKGAVSACTPGALASQALLHCPRLNKLHFMVVLNPSSSFHGIRKKSLKI